jgi:hypothetical protein
MTNSSVIAFLGVVVLAIGIGIGVFLGQPSENVSGVHYGEDAFQQVQIGDAGSEVTKVIEGTCNAATTLLPLEATSTDSFTCTVAGVASGDQCSVSLRNYDLAFGALTVQGCTASTNTITFGIVNGTGAATSSFPLATTSVSYHVEK